MARRESSDLPASTATHPLGQVAGATHADNLRHAYLRAHFMNALLTDPRIIDLFDQWGTHTGLYRAADAVARAADDVAQAAKVSHWMDAFQRGGEEAGRVAPYVETFTTAAVRFVAEQLQCVVTADVARALANVTAAPVAEQRRVRPTPSAFVRETLKLRWGWLAYEIIDSFLRHVSARAFGSRIVRSFTVVYQSPPVPRLAWHVGFETNEGETVTEARVRLLRTWEEAGRACGDALRAMEQAERKARGRRPNKQDGSYLQHWAEWFYRAEVKQPRDSVSALAREYSPDRRSTPAHTLPRRRVQLGIARAKRLLSQGVYEICEAPPPRQLMRRRTAR